MKDKYGNKPMSFYFSYEILRIDPINLNRVFSLGISMSMFFNQNVVSTCMVRGGGENPSESTT